MSNVLSEEKKQHVIALGRLGWPLRRIEQETGVRRETAGAYLKAAGIGVRPPGAWGRRPPSKPANENGVTTGSDAAKPANTVNPNPENLPNRVKAKPANAGEVTTGFGVELSASEPQTPPPVPSPRMTDTPASPADGQNILYVMRSLLPPARASESCLFRKLVPPSSSPKINCQSEIDLSFRAQRELFSCYERNFTVFSINSAVGL
jgi:hypothetical protein